MENGWILWHLRFFELLDSRLSYIQFPSKIIDQWDRD